jgi:cytochrome b6-f complex iron-sulfur subunit
MEKNTQNRAEFIKELGLSSATLMAFYCMGTLSACSKKDPEPVTPVKPGGNNSTKIDFTLDLMADANKSLKTDGEFIYVDNIIIVNNAGTYVALSKVCTHQGTTIKFRKGDTDFKCDNHGAEYKVDGTVKKGPAADTLKVYKTEVLESGNKLKITE